ncbi:MAG: NAD(P)H-dependent oxidoreductase, partial [Spirochaetaceae bacterium]|nr:NAD(P)H-dependent oxidoreductase [Spirochaetaceae bacterium]
MKILVLNGSPKGERSNSLQLTRAFLEGMGALQNHSVDTITVSQKDIKPCRGCFCCWDKTPGKCVIPDDMGGILDAYIQADMVIWSFPLYYYSVPGILKNLIDRLLPLNLPFMTDSPDGLGSGGHPPRYDLSGKRFVILSTCGFYSAEGNYDGVKNLFDRLHGKDQYAAIFCGQGELFRVPELRERTGRYLALVSQAGAEYMRGGIRTETEAALGELLFPKETFEAMADASWNITGGHSGAQTGEDKSLNFTRQMAALYRPQTNKKGRGMVLEFHYTDIDKTYQIVMTGRGHTVLTDSFRPFTTRIETPFSVWQDIAQGKISGQDALMQHKYRVSGDFNLMLHWDEYFGGGETGGKPARAAEGQKKPEKRSLLFCILPFAVFWTLINVLPELGAYITIIAAASVPLFMRAFSLTLYDVVSSFSVIALSIASLYLPLRFVMAASYGIFAALWLVSSLCTKMPLSAWYAAQNYGSEAAYQNPLFIRTNKIIDIGWGMVYVLCCLLMAAGVYGYAILVNAGGSLVMGIFTVWFQKWYPAYYAGK